MTFPVLELATFTVEATRMFSLMIVKELTSSRQILNEWLKCGWTSTKNSFT